MPFQMGEQATFPFLWISQTAHYFQMNQLWALMIDHYHIIYFISTNDETQIRNINFSILNLFSVYYIIELTKTIRLRVFVSNKKVFDEVFAINHNQIHSYSKSSKFYSWTISSNPLISPNFLKVFLSSEDFLQLFGIIQRLGFNNRFGFLHENQHENDTLTNESSKETKENEAVSDIYIDVVWLGSWNQIEIFNLWSHFVAKNKLLWTHRKWDEFHLARVQLKCSLQITRTKWFYVKIACYVRTEKFNMPFSFTFIPKINSLIWLFPEGKTVSASMATNKNIVT